MQCFHTCFLAGIALFLVSRAFSAELEEGAPLNRNRFSLSFDACFNVRATFYSQAPNVSVPPATGSGLTGDAIDRNYEDGYSRVDFFSNGAGLTWNWGYDSASQYVYGNNQTPPDGIAMHATSRSGYQTETDVTGDPQLGFEFRYGRVINALGGNKPWGFEFAFGYTDLSVKDDTPMASVRRVTDTYSLGGIVPPPAPYRGTFNGPGPLIEDLPMRSVEPALMGGWNELSGNLFAFRLGPFLEIPLGRRFVSQFGAGFSLIYANLNYSYSETATFAGGLKLFDSGNDSYGDVSFGGYFQGQLGYLLNEHWSLFVGLRLEPTSSITGTAGNREAKLDLGGAFHGIFGVGYGF